VALAIARAVAALDPALMLVGLSGSTTDCSRTRRRAWPVLDEAFADRRYQTNACCFT